MGYSTKFSGQFRLDRLPSAETIIALRALESEQGNEPGQPDSYCQWQLTRDCQGLEWDGGENFYEYIPWLQWIIDHVLIPADLHLSGAVQWQGEEVGDCGVLTVESNTVVARKLQVVGDDLATLTAFRDFVLGTRYGSELAALWKHKQERARGR